MIFSKLEIHKVEIEVSTETFFQTEKLSTIQHEMKSASLKARALKCKLAAQHNP